MLQPLDASDLPSGFAEPVTGSQRTFRAALEAMSYPGRVVASGSDLNVPPLDPAQAALALALVDYETPVWLDRESESAAGWLRFHCGCRIVTAPVEARFAVIAEARSMPSLSEFDAGSDEFPNRSATLLIRADELSAAAGGLRLSGPGIENEAALGVRGLAPRFWDDWAVNRALFPRGVDLFLTAGARLVGLPRTTRVRS